MFTAAAVMAAGIEKKTGSKLVPSTTPLKKSDGTRLPLQARAKQTYENILLATQSILQDSGLEALNTNAVAERTGVTTPVIYRYFTDKHAILTVLGEQLTDAQNAVHDIGDADPRDLQERDVLQAVILDVLTETHAVTSDFIGARAPLKSLRIIPGLSSVRLSANRKMAELTAMQLKEIRPKMGHEEAFDRSRLGVEVGYSAIEMPLETPPIRASNVPKLAASAITDIYLDETQ